MNPRVHKPKIRQEWKVVFERKIKEMDERMRSLQPQLKDNHTLSTFQVNVPFFNSFDPLYD